MGSRRQRWLARGLALRCAPALWVGLAVSVGACSEPLHPRTGTTEVVLQALLVLGAPRQTVWVEWSTPADSEYTAAPRPVAVDAVNLQLEFPTGERTSFTPHPTLPGRFDVEVPVQAGATYRLAGVVAGHVVTAEATVPMPLEINEPAADTVTIPLSSCTPVCRIPYRWSAQHAQVYAHQFQWFDQPARLVGGTHRETSGVLEVIPRPGTAELTVVAYEANAGSFLVATAPRSSVQGAFGMFGAASTATRVIIWE